MSGPGPVSFVPVWLSVADVKRQLRIDQVDVDDDDLVQACAAATEPQVQQSRPDCWQIQLVQPAPDVYEPDAEVYQAAVMLASRLVRRRNSTAGIETFSDSILYVSKYDPDIQRALRQGAYAWPGVG